MVLHEFIHKYLQRIWNPQKSEILKKFKGEEFNTLAHLHLMALEKTVYLKLKRKDLLQTAAHTYINIIKGDYKRAWELIEQHGHNAFIDDLKKSLK